MTRPAEKTADAIVRGRMQIQATDDASIGTIAVDTVYAGPAIADLAFIAPGMDEPAGPAVFYLDRDGDRYRVTRTELDASREPAAIHTRADFSAVSRDLEVFRKAAGQPWSPAQQPAVAAARKIFATVAMVGAESKDVWRALGPADETTAAGWRYVRHDGEAGAIYVVRVANDRVRAIEIHRTE